ncbi:MAG: MBL fold metallo-hydrolase [Anaerolineales bacterium]|nr:MBL fold metallo-hydrolase [Anaerolineales bacterium]
MFELTFLGTSASAPSIRRGLSAQVVSYRDQRFLIDCGEGTQRQILQSGIGFRRLNRILITHGHLDHILGLAGLLSTFMRWETIDTLEIFAGRHALDRIRDLIQGVVLRGARPPMRLELNPIEPGVLLEAGGLRITAFPVQHRSPGCYGFVFEAASHRPFLPERAEALGLPPGPLRRDLVAGQPAHLPDGRTILPDDVLGPVRRGTRLIHVGDCGSTRELDEVCEGADGLVIEATYLSVESDLARQFAHLTASDAAELAKRAGVGHLYLTHISRRYRTRDVLDEAAAIFPAVTVARDFDQFSILRSADPDLASAGHQPAG